MPNIRSNNISNNLKQYTKVKSIAYMLHLHVNSIHVLSKITFSPVVVVVVVIILIVVVIIISFH